VTTDASGAGARDPTWPLTAAIGLAVLYVALCSGYIVLSTRWAAELARSIVELERYERWKGLGFVAVTGLLFFGAAWLALRRIAETHAALVRQREALAAADGRVLTGTLAGGVAHDIRNVLTVAGFDLERASERERAGDAPGGLGALRTAFAELFDLSQWLLSLSRSGRAPSLARIELAGLVRDTLDFVALHAELRDCRVTTALEPNALVSGERALLARIVVNLVLNAAEAGHGHGRIDVRVERAGERIHLEVHDDGPGIDAERRTTIFDALRSTKPDGTGLGLFSVRYTAELLGGSVELDASPLGGALFRVVLPALGGRSEAR
jgi:signal transduction histidine kinase